MKLAHIDLQDLSLSPVNVRRKGGKDVADLIPSIRSLGIIQPLLVRSDGEGFEIVAGQRRYHALTALAQEGLADPVPCIVMDQGDDARAIAIRLTPAGERVTAMLTPAAQQLEAAAVAGLSEAEIAQLKALLDRVYGNLSALPADEEPAAK